MTELTYIASGALLLVAGAIALVALDQRRRRSSMPWKRGGRSAGSGRRAGKGKKYGYAAVDASDAIAWDEDDDDFDAQAVDVVSTAAEEDDASAVDDHEEPVPVLGNAAPAWGGGARKIVLAPEPEAEPPPINAPVWEDEEVAPKRPSKTVVTKPESKQMVSMPTGKRAPSVAQPATEEEELAAKKLAWQTRTLEMDDDEFQQPSKVSTSGKAASKTPYPQPLPMPPPSAAPRTPLPVAQAAAPRMATQQPRPPTPPPQPSPSQAPPGTEEEDLMAKKLAWAQRTLEMED